MLVLNETINISRLKSAEWLEWMKSVQIPDVLSTGLVSDVKIMRVLGQDEKESITYAVHFTALTDSDFEVYARDYFPKFTENQKTKFKDQYNNFKTLLEVVY